MVQQLSHHTVCIKYQIIWLCILFAILGFVKSCDDWYYHADSDDTNSTLRHFMNDLHREIKSIDNKNEMKIIKMLISQNKSRLLRINNCYNDCYKSNLIADLKNKLTGKLEEIAVGLVTPEMEYSVKLIHDSMVGIESDSCALIDILCTQNFKTLQQIKSTYQKLYRTPLDMDLDKYSTGLFRRLLLALFKWRRTEDIGMDRKLADMDAEKLKSGIDIFRTDRLLMSSILVTGSFSRIRQAVYRYHDKYNEYFESRIGENYGGDVKRALISIVRWSKGKDCFYAEKLHANLNFIETDDHSLVRIIISNLANMEPIKKEYKRRYKMSLENAIRGKISGSYADALIALINKEKEQEQDEDNENENEDTIEEIVEEFSPELYKKKWCLWC